MITTGYKLRSRGTSEKNVRMRKFLLTSTGGGNRRSLMRFATENVNIFYKDKGTGY